jgi:autotransporter adhesin
MNKTQPFPLSAGSAAPSGARHPHKRRVLRLLPQVLAVTAALSCSGMAWAESGGGVSPGATNGVCQQGGPDNLACGFLSTAVGGNSTAVGIQSTASGSTSTAVGSQSTASGAGATALGFASTAKATGATAIGIATNAFGIGSTAVGQNSAAIGFGSTAIGQDSGAIGTGSLASGGNSMASGAGDIALGDLATTTPPIGRQTNGNIAIGAATGIVNGGGFSASTSANGGNSVAIGTGTQSTGANSVALGAGSSDGGAANVVSVGSTTQTRRIIDLGAGVNATDAANFGQVQVAQAAAVSTANSYTNTQVTQIQAALAHLAAAGVCKSAGNGSYVCGNGAAASGQDASAQGAGATASGADTLAVGTQAHASFAGSVAIGAGAQANADPTLAVGDNAIANGNDSVALGANTTANGSNSVALGQGSVANRANVVSVGSSATGLTRQITNLAAGTAPTDAVNLGQLEQATSGILGQAETYAAGAAAAAMVQTAPQILPGKTEAVAAKVGEFDGQSAVGASYAHLIGGDAIGTFSLSAAQGGQVGATAGVQLDW